MQTFRTPERFSPEWWIWITTATFVFAAISFGSLFYLDIFDNITALIVGVILVSFVGDIVVAIAFEAIAPSRISVAPGERARNDQQISAVGVVASGFDSSIRGHVSIRGELWAARHHRGKVVKLTRGDEIRIVGRDGLTLLISDSNDECFRREL